MDPKACLDRMESAIEAGDEDEIQAAYADYWNWRHGGGFEPEGGDLRAHALYQRSLWVTKPVST